MIPSLYFVCEKLFEKFNKFNKILKLEIIMMVEMLFK